jgi:hypothetical protein
MSENVSIDLDKLRARMLREPANEDAIDLLFALIEDQKRQLDRAETERKAWTEIGAKAEADAAALLAIARDWYEMNAGVFADRYGEHDTVYEVMRTHQRGASAALLAELTAARAALEQIDRHVVGACENCFTGMIEPCEECGEMREIAAQALAAMREAREG